MPIIVTKHTHPKAYSSHIAMLKLNDPAAARRTYGSDFISQITRGPIRASHPAVQIIATRADACAHTAHLRCAGVVTGSPSSRYHCANDSSIRTLSDTAAGRAIRSSYRVRGSRFSPGPTVRRLPRKRIRSKRRGADIVKCLNKYP